MAGARCGGLTAAFGWDQVALAGERSLRAGHSVGWLACRTRRGQGAYGQLGRLTSVEWAGRHRPQRSLRRCHVSEGDCAMACEIAILGTPGKIHL